MAERYLFRHAQVPQDKVHLSPQGYKIWLTDLEMAVGRILPAKALLEVSVPQKCQKGTPQQKQNQDLW